MTRKYPDEYYKKGLHMEYPDGYITTATSIARVLHGLMPDPEGRMDSIAGSSRSNADWKATVEAFAASGVVGHERDGFPYWCEFGPPTTSRFAEGDK